MKFYASKLADKSLQPDLQYLLDRARDKRGFDPKLYIHEKALVLNNYMRSEGLSAVVVAVSGGIDSAIVAGILAYARKLPNSPIKTILPICLPALHSDGATNQLQATMRGYEVIGRFGLDGNMMVNIQPIVKAIVEQFEIATGMKATDWAEGQLVSYVRTPILYMATSVLSSSLNQPAILVGTTNRDEGGYIGYFGKASDGMVDIQLISDIHKSEVYKVALELNVPKSIIDIPPSGDMYDGRIDEEVFGVPYDFVELYMYYLSGKIPTSTTPQWIAMAEHVEQLHQYNHHKYLGQSPAVHLDIIDSGVPGGWEHKLVADPFTPKKLNTFVNEQNIPLPELAPVYMDGNSHKVHCGHTHGHWVKMLDEHERQSILEALSKITEWAETDIDGYVKSKDYHIGSYRVSKWDPEFATQLWQRLSQVVGPVYDDGDCWVPTGLSPLLRFIKYEQGGILIPHYDAPYVYGDKKKTMMSVVLVLEAGGEAKVRFFHDPRPDRFEYKDWDAEYSPIMSQQYRSVPGTALIFNHRELHDSPEVLQRKIILRTDVEFERA